MKRSTLGPGKLSLERGSTFATPRTPLRTKRRPSRGKPSEEQTAKQRHRAEVFARDNHVCALVDVPRVLPDGAPLRCVGRLQADHVIELNWLRVLHDRRKAQDGIGLALDFDDVVADGRNGWILCERHHGLKTAGLIVIPRSVIPPSVFDFNDDYDCAHLMESRACFA